MSAVRDNSRRILERIAEASIRSGRRPESVRLVAATKTVEPVRIVEAVECGVRDIGENRVQEAEAKRAALAAFPLRWHFIGHLQSNKAGKAVRLFDWIQSLDRPGLARRLDQLVSQSLPVLVEVQLEKEGAKSGVLEPDLTALVELVRSTRWLDLKGFMAIPPLAANAEGSRPYFRRVGELAARFGLPEVSMGMSHDFEVAIEEGSTMVRIGRALFGAPAVIVRVRVIPNAARDEITDTRNDEIVLRVRAPATDGKASRAVRNFLASRLRVPKSAVRLTLGAKSRHKTLKIDGLEHRDRPMRLAALAGPDEGSL